MKEEKELLPVLCHVGEVESAVVLEGLDEVVDVLLGICADENIVQVACVDGRLCFIQIYHKVLSCFVSSESVRLKRKHYGYFIFILFDIS